MSRRLKLTLFPLLFVFGVVFMGASGLFGDNISSSTSFSLTNTTANVETGFDLQFDTSENLGSRNEIIIDFSFFGSGAAASDFDLQNLSIDPFVGYTFTNFGTAAKHVGSADMSSGYTGWTATPEDFNITVNGVGPTNVVLNTDTTDVATTVAEINAELGTALVAGVEAYDAGNNYVGIRTILPGATEDFVLAAGTTDALVTLGWTAAAYSGTDDDPSTINRDLTGKTITFSGCTIDPSIENVTIQYTKILLGPQFII